MSVAIQGFGNAGSYATAILHDMGYTIVAVSDSSGAVYCKTGLHPHHLIQIKQEQGTVQALAKKDKSIKLITNEELLACECDVLIPAALDNQLREDNADKVKARFILELANGPTTPEADAIFEKKGIMVFPDVLANAGGVTVSYFEWVQNRMHYYWTEKEVLQKLKPIMVNALNDVEKVADEKKISLRQAAFILAVQRILKAMKLRGRELHTNSFLIKMYINSYWRLHLVMIICLN